MSVGQLPLLSWSPPPPTLAGFQTYLTGVVGLPSTALPLSSLFIQYALNSALEVVSQDLNNASPDLYTDAVYSLATSLLINYAPDPLPIVVYPTGDVGGLGFFAYTRNQWDLTSFLGGTIASSSDEGTSQSLSVPEYFKYFTVYDLQLLKDPYGRRYIGYAHKYGTTVWGLT
jgi:hypothetical protein